MIRQAGPADVRRDRSRSRILLLGEDSPGALMHSYADAFRELGLGVRAYCLRRAFESGIPSLPRRVADRLAPRLLLARFNARVLRDLRGERPLLTLVLKGERLSPSTVKALRETTGAPIANFYPDDPFSNVRSNRLAFGTGVLRAYDRCFTYARSLLPRFVAAGVDRAEWLPFARDPKQHRPVERAGEPEFEVVFAGNLDGERVRWLEPLAGRVALAIAGEHTVQALPTRSPLRGATFLPAAYGRELALLLARAAISLNVMREQNRFSHNMRSFESPACGAFTLSQRTPELEELFREDEEIAFADSPGDLPMCCQHWLARPADRARIARAGYGRVAGDTYARRARTVLRSMGLEDIRPEQGSPMQPSHMAEDQ